MANNVFGNPITNETLEGLPEYMGKKITRKDRARVALKMRNAEEKASNAITFIENLKRQWGVGVSTLCLVYNATGDPIKYVTSHNWWGHIGPSPYPPMIENGQWGAFLHVKTSGTATGSVAAVVYRGKNGAGDECDRMIAWSNPWNRNLRDNKVYTEIREAGHFVHSLWRYIKHLLDKSGVQHTDTWNGCFSTMATGSFTSPKLEAILTLTSDD